MPIYAEHPEFQPPDLREQSPTKRRRLPSDVAERLLEAIQELDAKVTHAMALIEPDDDKSKALQQGAAEIFQALGDTKMFVNHASGHESSPEPQE